MGQNEIPVFALGFVLGMMTGLILAFLSL